MLVTVFTPTYNRAHLLERLYESLVIQTSCDFEWILLDDGSNDNTEVLVENFIKDKKISITYIKTQNGGKSRAINNGVKAAKGDLFFIVDSDDYIKKNAIEQIVYQWNNISNNSNIGGLCFRKVNYRTNEVIGGSESIPNGEYNSLELAYILGINADKAEIFRTSVLKEFVFPEFDGENFVPEALVWNRISAKYKLKLVNSGIYMCDYLEDGLTHNFSANLKKNPKGFALFYKEVQTYKLVPFIAKIKAKIRFIQCRKYIYCKKHR